MKKNKVNKNRYLLRCSRQVNADGAYTARGGYLILGEGNSIFEYCRSDTCFWPYHGKGHGIALQAVLCYCTPFMQIVLATRNRKKVEEISRITAGLPITVLSLDDYPDCPDVVEDRDTFEGNASKKALEIAKCTGKPALSDDSGLEVDALNGSPGVYSARYDPDAENGNDPKNVLKLLRDLATTPEGKRGARFVCCIALAFPDGEVRTFFGYAEGSIGREARGKMGFGYDPVFIPKGYENTFAEMGSKEKDLLSHRGQALDKLSVFLRNFLKH